LSVAGMVLLLKSGPPSIVLAAWYALVVSIRTESD